jgi:hypothetical protein
MAFVSFKQNTTEEDKIKQTKDKTHMQHFDPLKNKNPPMSN